MPVMIDQEVKNSVFYLELQIGFLSSSVLGGCPPSDHRLLVQMLRHQVCWICTRRRIIQLPIVKSLRCMAPCSYSVAQPLLPATPLAAVL
eukprot:2325688-Amphidinium_carterae.3